MENIIKAKKVKQNNQEFLLGVFTINQIQNFTRYTERLIVGYKSVDDKDKVFEDQSQIVPDYNPQVQRKTNNAKVERIADFLITDPTAMFPTNIVIAIPQQVIDDKSEDGDGNTTIKLNEIVKKELEKKDGDVFLTIIDGQHRIKGIERAIQRLENSIAFPKPDEVELKAKFEAILQRLLNLELIITFFVDPILEYQAMIFSTINKTQTKVPENLVFSLFGLSNSDTPQKTSLEVCLALNGIEKSPFYNKIKLVGGNYKRGESAPISQATIVKSILFRICKNQRESEIERNKERQELKNNFNGLCFREFYSENNDKMIVRTLYSYFNAVKEAFKNERNQPFWEIGSTNETNVLQTNVGFQALMKILDDLLEIIPKDKNDDKSTYLEYLIKAKDIDWSDTLSNEKRYPFTSKSINILYNDIKSKIFN